MKDHPASAEAVKEHVAYHNCRNECRVESEEHPHVIRRPEVVRDPFDEAAVRERLVENVDDLRREKKRSSMPPGDGPKTLGEPVAEHPRRDRQRHHADNGERPQIVPKFGKGGIGTASHKPGPCVDGPVDARIF